MVIIIKKPWIPWYFLAPKKLAKQKKIYFFVNQADSIWIN